MSAMVSIPQNYRRLAGSERRPAPGARLLGPADDDEAFTVTIILRRRSDGPPPPAAAAFMAPRERMSRDAFVEKYGAAPDDIAKVVDFAKSQGLTVADTDPAQRSVVVSGTVAQMSRAFAVSLGKYEQSVASETETYRGREGYIHVPAELADVIVGVFGLDDRGISKRNAADPPSNNNEITN
jgi:kumamolisin